MRSLKKFFLVTILLFIYQMSYGQNPGDTIVVNSFNYGMTYGVGNRDTTVLFPDQPGLKFEKILMQYNMRCKNGAVSTGSNTNLGCGEWDYSCNTYVHDSSRVDSVRNTTSTHSISNFSGTTFNYTNVPQFNFYQFTQQNVAVNAIITENQFNLLTGTTPMSSALAGANYSGKSQYLYTAAELVAAGFSAGNIDGFLVNALNGGPVNFLSVNIQGTTLPTLDSNNVLISGFTQVFFSNYTFVAGSNRIQFYTPFIWNGTDNLIFEISYTNSVAGSDIFLEGTSSSPYLAITANNGYFQKLSSNGHITLPVAGLSGITNEVTVSFWAFGDAALMPINTTLIEGLGAQGERDLNIHLPWSNSQVYWDCGGNSSVDRINKVATSAEFEGQWNHWAFVKNATTGSMQIFLNGVLWHSGSGNVKPIDIAELVVGKSVSLANNYKGSIDELTIWKKALTVSEIQNWKNVPVNSSHPQYGHLVAYYPFDEGTGLLNNDISTNAAVAIANGTTFWESTRGIKLNRFFKSTGIRPSLKLVRGNYNSTISPIVVLDSNLVDPNVVHQFAIVSHSGTLLNDEIDTVSSLQFWEAIGEKIYDGVTGALLSTIPTTAIGSITPSTLNYFKRYPMKFEIMSFVTPYGINLNLGPNGKTWTFDMTDYSPILKGSKRITMERGGQWQEDMDIKFLFIVGTPYRDVLDIREVWRTDSRGYASIVNNQYFEPIDVPTLATGNAFKVRTSISGHGQEGEFIPQNHFLNANGGTTEFNWQVWKECAENPVYPQGGTWIYDRAGWCPGMATNVQESDITAFVSPGSSVNLDYGVSTASGTSNYIVSNQLVTYGAINKTLDAEVVEINQPTTKVEFERFNAICASPKVTIKNSGSIVLTSAKINYWVNNSSSPSVYNWAGSLLSGEETVIELPSSYTLWSSISATNNIFHAEITNPNGASDVYLLNNHYKSKFILPNVLPSNIVVEFKTNLYPGENSYQLLDDQNNVILSRSGMAANTVYKDTLILPMGCYTFKVSDSDDDGISFWANSDGSGYARFREVGGPILKSFNGDFGDNINYNFTVLSQLSLNEFNELTDLSVYPNPTSNELNLVLRNFAAQVDVSLIDNLGKVVQRNGFNTIQGANNCKINISSLPNGFYTLKVSDGLKTSFVKIIKN